MSSHSDLDFDYKRTTSPLNASDDADDESDIDALGSEIFDDIFGAEEETQEEHNAAATSQHYANSAVTFPSRDDHTDDTEGQTNNLTRLKEHLHGNRERESGENIAKGAPQASQHDTSITAAPSQADKPIEKPKQSVVEFDEKWDAFAAGQDVQSYRAAKQAAALLAVSKATNGNPSSNTLSNEAVVEGGPEKTFDQASNVSFMNDVDGNNSNSSGGDCVGAITNRTQSKVLSDDLKDILTKSTNGQSGEGVSGCINNTQADAAYTNCNDINMALSSYSSSGNLDDAAAVSTSKPGERDFAGVQDRSFKDMRVDLQGNPQRFNINFSNGLQGQGFASSPASMNGFGDFASNAPAEPGDYASRYASGNDQARVSLEATRTEVSGSLNRDTTPQFGDPNARYKGLDMSPRSRSKIVKAFLRIYLSSEGELLAYINTRLTETQRRIKANISSASLPSASGASGTTDMVNSVWPASQSQPLPAHQMQNHRAAAQAGMHNSQMPMQPSYMGYGNGSHVYNGPVLGVVPSFGAVSASEQHSVQRMAGGMNAMNTFNPTLDFGGFRHQGSFSFVPGFNSNYPVQQGQVPATPNPNLTASNNQVFNMQGHYSNNHMQSTNPTSYGPPVSNSGSQFMQESLRRDDIQQINTPSNYATAHYVNNSTDMILPPTSAHHSKSKHKRRHSESWETGRLSTSIQPRVSLPLIEVNSQATGHSDATAASVVEVPPGNDDDIVDTFFAFPEASMAHSVCMYRCPITGMVCNRASKSKDTRNRYRHLATHAEEEKKLIEDGRLEIEKALLGQLKPIVVTCNHCDFHKEVWRTDGIREEHEKEAHQDIYEHRQENRKRNKKE